MFCEKCGIQLSNHEKFCPSCGTKSKQISLVINRVTGEIEDVNPSTSHQKNRSPIPKTSEVNHPTQSFRNFKSAVNGLARPTSRIISKGIEKTFIWMATDHTGISQSSSTLDALLGINFSIARGNLIVRRMERMNDLMESVLDSEAQMGLLDWVLVVLEFLFFWIIDHLIFLLNVIWGFFEPILTMLFMALFRVVLIIVCNVIFFGAIYLLLTSKSHP